MPEVWIELADNFRSAYAKNPDNWGKRIAMHLIQILLPLTDNAGRPYPDDLLQGIQSELSQCFGGLTAYRRAPAKGVWTRGHPKHRRRHCGRRSDGTEHWTPHWWREFRTRLQQILRQEGDDRRKKSEPFKAQLKPYKKLLYGVLTGRIGLTGIAIELRHVAAHYLVKGLPLPGILTAPPGSRSLGLRLCRAREQNGPIRNSTAIRG